MILITITNMEWCHSSLSDFTESQNFSAMQGLCQDVHVSLWVSWNSLLSGKFWTG